MLIFSLQLAFWGNYCLNCLRKLPSPLSCPLSSSYYPRTRPPPLNHSSDCPKMFLTTFDNPFDDFHPTILFYTASTAGFRRYIVCIPIYPYSLISILFFLNFCTHTPSTFCRYHTLESLSSLLPFYSVSLAIDFLVFLLSFHRFLTLHTICMSAASATTQLAAPAVARAPFR